MLVGTSRAPSLSSGGTLSDARREHAAALMTAPSPPRSPMRALRAVKALHTIVWAFFAGCILAIPVLVWRDNLPGAFLLIAIVLVEVVVLVANRWRCPMTDVAARYTTDRRDNFDIYLPAWLARYNKAIFGSLFLLGLLLALLRWMG